MRETLQQRENAMCAVLRKIQNKVDFSDLSFEEQRIAKECYDAKLFEGIVLIEMISGRIIAEYRHDPRLTIDGLKFLDSNERGEELTNILEERSSDNYKEKNQTVKKRFHIVVLVIKKLWWLFCAIGVFVTVFGWPAIIRFFKWLLSSIFHIQ